MAGRRVGRGGGRAARRRLAAVPRPDGRQQVAGDRHPDRSGARAVRRSSGTASWAPATGSARWPRGRFFQFDRDGDQARLTCLDARTGKLLWKFEYPTDYEDRVGYNNGPRSSPVIDDDRVYLFGAEGMLHCVRADDGKLLWKVDTAKQFGVVQNFFGVGSTPVVYGDLLLVMVGGSPAESQDAGRFDMDRVQGQRHGHRGLRQAHRRGEVRASATSWPATPRRNWPAIGGRALVLRASPGAD